MAVGARKFAAWRWPWLLVALLAPLWAPAPADATAYSTFPLAGPADSALMDLDLVDLQSGFTLMDPTVDYVVNPVGDLMLLEPFPVGANWSAANPAFIQGVVKFQWQGTQEGGQAVAPGAQRILWLWAPIGQSINGNPNATPLYAPGTAGYHTSAFFSNSANFNGVIDGTTGLPVQGTSDPWIYSDKSLAADGDAGLMADVLGNNFFALELDLDPDTPIFITFEVRLTAPLLDATNPFQFFNSAFLVTQSVPEPSAGVLLASVFAVAILILTLQIRRRPRAVRQRDTSRIRIPNPPNPTR